MASSCAIAAARWPSIRDWSCARGLLAVGLGLAQLALALADALLRDPAGRGDRQPHRVVEDLGDAIGFGLGHVAHFLLVVVCVRPAGQARSELLVALTGDPQLALEAPAPAFRGRPAHP